MLRALLTGAGMGQGQGQRTAASDREALIDLLGPEFERHVDNIPFAMARELLADDQGFITRQQMTVELARRFTPDMRDMASPDALRAVLPRTAFFRTRMQPLAGALGAVTCRPHPRYLYFPYLPLSHYLDPRDEATLIVALHGSSRSAQAQRSGFAAFAERHRCFVLAPMFPIDLDAHVPDEEYKYVAGSRERFDLVLLDMIEDFADAAGVRFERLFLCGFSGGGQFAHRFFYVHPERIAALSIGAPGFVTLPDPNRDWWAGVRNLEAIFGRSLDLEAMRRVPVQMVCGAGDNIPFEIYPAAEMGLSEAEYRDYGADRLHRVHRLRAAYEALGISVRLDVLPGCAHSFEGGMADAMQAFFRMHL